MRLQKVHYLWVTKNVPHPYPMIKKLSVSNYALIDHLQVEPASGLSILTGETGAGKSIILGALALATGARADLSALRDKDRKCVVELTVDIGDRDMETFFAEYDLDYEPQTIIRREILPGGKSRAFVNDTPVLLDTLNELSSLLVDVHSQHQSLLLSRHEYRIGIADKYAGNAVLLTRYRKAFAGYRTLESRLELLNTRKAELSKTQDYNRYLLDELDKAALKDENEQEELENLCARLENAQQITADLFGITQLMDAEGTGILLRLAEVYHLLRKNDKYFPGEDHLAERAESALIELKDIATQVSSYLADNDGDPDLLERSSARLDTLYSLERKHGVPDIVSLIRLREELRSEVSGLENIEEEIETVQKNLSDARNALEQAAKELSEARQEAAGKLSDEITATVRSLGMANAEFQVEVSPAGHFTEAGADNISFLFSANLGQTPAQVEKVASGGELSRIMLAVKYALARRADLPSVVFDEIDTGVSGDIADRMGRIMQDMSRHMQVVAITHLPQIASRGDRHYKVFKVEENGTTLSRIAVLDENERTTELAQMISGADITAAAMEHARELLRQNRLSAE